MSSGQSPLIVLALSGVISLDVSDVVFTHPVNSSLYRLHTTLHSHGLSGEVCVGTSTIPVSCHWLGVKGDYYTKIFSNPLQGIPGHPEIITHINTLSGSNLVFPLGRHNLCIGSRDPNTSKQTGSVVSLNNISAINPASSNPAVVRSLWARETILGTTKWMTILIQESVLLFNSKPRVLVFSLFHHLKTSLPLVGICGLLVVFVSLTHYQNVVSKSEWVRVHLDRVQVGVGVTSLSLISGASIIIPDRQFCNIIGLLLQGLGLRSESFTSAINPDIKCLYPLSLRKFHVSVEDSLVGFRR